MITGPSRPRRRARSAALGLAIATGALLGFGASEAVAGPGTCTTTWAYAGGNVSTGGCKAGSQGNWFQVVQFCGAVHYKAYSPWTWAPARTARSATTSACPWYARGIRNVQVIW
jgi:hypothetical protein